MSIQTLSIRAKLVAVFSLLTLFVIGLGVLGIVSTQRMREQALEIENNWLPSIRVLGEIDTMTARNNGVMLRHTQETDPQRLATIEGDLVRFGKKLDDKKVAYERLISSPEERELYETFVREAAKFAAIRQTILDMSRNGEKAQAYSFYENKGITIRRGMSDALEKLVNLNNAGADQAQARSKTVFEEARTLGIVGIVVAVVLSVLSAFMIIRGVSRGIDSVVQPMQALAAGDLSVTIPHQNVRTEIGRIADAVQVFKDGLNRMKALEDENALARAGADAQRKAAMRSMADGFESAIGGIIQSVSSSATELQATAQSMAGTATETAAQSTGAAAAAEQAAANVTTVAAAAEELGSSVQEIGRQVSASASLAHVAVEETARTAVLVKDLNSAVAKIGDVVTMISAIAGQTNLLALNATIEAARAGEAGKGFAVVASEVKQLATQTAKATEEIGAQIAMMQSATQDSVAAIKEIGSTIDTLAGIANAIAAAVEEQGAATQEISRNVQEAAQGTAEVAGNISSVNSGAAETGSASAQVLSSAQSLSRESEVLQREVARFIETVKAA